MARTTVVVAVEPRLLGDVVCGSLASDDVVVSPAESVGPGDRFDVAVVSPGHEGEVHATHVITLPQDDAEGDFGLSYLRGRLAALVQRAGD